MMRLVIAIFTVAIVGGCSTQQVEEQQVEPPPTIAQRAEPSILPSQRPITYTCEDIPETVQEIAFQAATAYDRPTKLVAVYAGLGPISGQPFYAVAAKTREAPGHRMMIWTEPNLFQVIGPGLEDGNDALGAALRAAIACL